MSRRHLVADSSNPVRGSTDCQQDGRHMYRAGNFSKRNVRVDFLKLIFRVLQFDSWFWVKILELNDPLDLISVLNWENSYFSIMFSPRDQTWRWSEDIKIVSSVTLWHESNAISYVTHHLAPVWGCKVTCCYEYLFVWHLFHSELVSVVTVMQAATISASFSKISW